MYKFIIIFSDGVRIERDGFNFSISALKFASRVISQICSNDGQVYASHVFILPSDETIDCVED